jgi:hypothetical protein
MTNLDTWEPKIRQSIVGTSLEKHLLSATKKEQEIKDIFIGLELDQAERKAYEMGMVSRVLTEDGVPYRTTFVAQDDLWHYTNLFDIDRINFHTERHSPVYGRDYFGGDILSYYKGRKVTDFSIG